MVIALQESRPPRFHHFSLALLAFAQLMYSLDINIVFVSLPEIGAGLGFSEHTLQWVVSAYTVCCGGFLLFGGRAADLLGHRRVFIGALWLYALSSLAGGLAWSPAVIIIARAIQGIGAALLFPATLSLINRLFEEGPSRNRALAVWVAQAQVVLHWDRSLAGYLLVFMAGRRYFSSMSYWQRLQYAQLFLSCRWTVFRKNAAALICRAL